MHLWRISKFADLGGKGGELVSGRWHEKGNRIVYCADHPSTALLEMIVHMSPRNIPETFQLLKIELPADNLKGDVGISEPQELSVAERGAIEMLRMGITESQIAENLRISRSTVRQFLSGTFSKLKTMTDITADEFIQSLLRLRIQESDFTVRFGMDWLTRKESLVLKVPSAVMPAATNYLLNPRHPDIHNAKIIEIFEYPFDRRLR